MYYIFSRNTRPRRWIDDEPFVEGVSFISGARITRTVPQPLEFTLKRINPAAEDHSAYLPATLGYEIPLLRADLIAALGECGVVNLDLYAAVISAPEMQEPITTYQAVNIVGILPVADMQKSSMTIHGSAPLTEVAFDELVVDPAQARGLLMFRLAQARGTVLVHEKVRDHLLSRGFDDLAFHEPSRAAV